MSLLFARRYHVSILISALVLLATMAMTSHYDFGIGGFLGKATRLRGRSIDDRGLVRKLMGTSQSTSKKLDPLIDEEDAFRVLEHSSEDPVEEDVDDDGDDDDDDDMGEGNSEEDEKEEESGVEESEGEEMMGEDSAEEVSEESESEEEESEEAESVEENEVSEEEESVEKESKQEETEEEGEKPVGNIGEEEENEEEATQTTSAKKKEEEGNESKSEEKSEEQEAKATPEPEYTPTDDDPIQKEDESIVEQVEQELEREEKVARTAGGFGIFLAIGAMIFTAHQMSENPDGIFAR